MVLPLRAQSVQRWVPPRGQRLGRLIGLQGEGRPEERQVVAFTSARLRSGAARDAGSRKRLFSAARWPVLRRGDQGRGPDRRQAIPGGVLLHAWWWRWRAGVVVAGA